MAQRPGRWSDRCNAARHQCDLCSAVRCVACATVMSVDAPASSTRTVPASVVSSVFVLIWASGFVAARFVAPHAEAFTFVAIRLVGVAIVLTAITLGLGARWPRSRAGWRDALVAGVLMQGIYVIGVFWSVERGLPSGIAALVGSLQPLLTAAMARPFLGEIVSPRRWIGIATGFAGALLVLAPKIGTADASGIPALPLLACLGAMAAMTIGTLWQKSRAGQAELLPNAAIQFVGATLLAVPAALLFGTGRFDASPAALGRTGLVDLREFGGGHPASSGPDPARRGGRRRLPALPGPPGLGGDGLSPVRRDTGPDPDGRHGRGHDWGRSRQPKMSFSLIHLSIKFSSPGFVEQNQASAQEIMNSGGIVPRCGETPLQTWQTCL